MPCRTCCDEYVSLLMYVHAVLCFSYSVWFQDLVCPCGQGDSESDMPSGYPARSLHLWHKPAPYAWWALMMLWGLMMSWGDVSSACYVGGVDTVSIVHACTCRR